MALYINFTYKKKLVATIVFRNKSVESCIWVYPHHFLNRGHTNCQTIQFRREFNLMSEFPLEILDNARIYREQ